MAGFIGEDQVRRIKEAVDLVDIFESYTTVRRAGADFKACCPIHNERTPSCHIYTDQQTFHCFGCGAHGDSITLIREMENCSFTEAVEMLARRARIDIVYEKGGNDKAKKSKRERLLAAHEFACKFYEFCLWNYKGAQGARDYLSERGLTEETCKQFRLGWAPGHGKLVKTAQAKNIRLADLAELDLLVDQRGQLTDRFYNRITFPICDRFGHPIAFSARLLPADERAAKEAGRGVGKYINSRDTPLYHKGSVVYNLHQARRSARKMGRILVMEGPTDVMAAAQAGISECAAVLGTALTKEHALQLGQMLDAQGRVFLVLDGDKAGQANAIKAIKTCMSVQVPARVAMMPDGLDPAECLRSDNDEATAEDFLTRIQAAPNDIDHLMRSLAPYPGQLDQRELLHVADECLGVIVDVLDQDLQALLLQDITTYLGLELSMMQRRLADARMRQQNAPSQDRAQNRPQPTRENAVRKQAQQIQQSPEEIPDYAAALIDEVEDFSDHLQSGYADDFENATSVQALPNCDDELDQLLRLLVHVPVLRTDLRKQFRIDDDLLVALEAATEGLSDLGVQPGLWSQVMAALLQNQDYDAENLLRSDFAAQYPDFESIVHRWLRERVEESIADELFADCVYRLKEKALNTRIQYLKAELKRVEQGDDQAEQGRLFKEIMQLEQERRKARSSTQS